MWCNFIAWKWRVCDLCYWLLMSLVERQFTVLFLLSEEISSKVTNNGHELKHSHWNNSPFPHNVAHIWRLSSFFLSLPAGLCWPQHGGVCRFRLHRALLYTGGLRHQEHSPGQLHFKGEPRNMQVPLHTCNTLLRHFLVLSLICNPSVCKKCKTSVCIDASTAGNHWSVFLASSHTVVWVVWHMCLSFDLIIKRSQNWLPGKKIPVPSFLCV